MNYFRSVTLLVAACALAACSRNQSAPPPAADGAPRVGAITLGRALAADKTVADPTDSFAPRDTFYLSVKTDGGVKSAELKARWTFEDGQMVDESTQRIAAGGPAVTEFHVSKPNGWPSGDYKVEVSLDGSPAGGKEFKVHEGAV